ncbi:condensation domain-containing protein [Micromonospora sp. CPCC 206061]|uniref:condensation domain-containing protein n=1 Tax=Micromonospora sp. CPCC 206061 TaxID=3122410 RepID=UPI002FEE6F94
MLISFRGARGGDAPLTWGQRSTRRWIDWLGPYEASLNVPYVLPVPAGSDNAAVREGLRRLVERHEALRTTYPDGAQRVLRAGSLDVVTRTGDPEAVLAELAAEPFRHDDGVPVRCAIVDDTAVALVTSHLSTDWSAMMILAAELPALVRGESLPEPTWHPLDQAAAEATPEAVRHNAEALAHWRSILERAPRSLLDFPERTPEPERFVRLGMDSPALAAAAPTLASRWGVSVGSLLATTAGAALATLGGHETAALRVICGNRREAPLRGMVGKAAQDGLFAVDLAASTLRGIVHDGHTAAKRAYRYGRYDPYALDALKGTVRHERGASLDLLAFFNDLRMGRSWSVPDADPAKTRFFVDFSTPGARARAFFTLEYAPDTCLLFVLADTAYLSRDTGWALLRAVEALVLRGLADGDVPASRIADTAGLEPVRRPAGWRRAGPDWYDPSAVAEVVRVACRAADVAVDADLTAHLTSDVNTPEAAHALVMGALAGRTDVLAPRRYVLNGRRPASGRDPLDHDGP